MGKLNFVQVKKTNALHKEMLRSMILPYLTESGSDSFKVTSLANKLAEQFQESMSGTCPPFERNLEIAFDGFTAISFIHVKVDRAGMEGFVKPNYGHIMEFYIKPEFRTLDYAQIMISRCDFLFALYGIKDVYMLDNFKYDNINITDLGFKDSGECTPEGIKIFVRKLSLSTMVIR